MLIKVTNYCSMGCSHCMENSTVAGEHMTREVFAKALDLSAQLEEVALAAGLPPLLSLSGGECTEHPDFVTLVQDAIARRRWHIQVITNGTWLENTELRVSLLREEWRNAVRFQVTSDPRFYPRQVREIDHPRLVYVDALTHLVPLGRLKPSKTLPLPLRRSPTSFNIRSITRSLGDVRKAIAVMRTPRLPTKPLGDQCSPSISANGEVVAGETNSCFVVGTVDSTLEEITQNLIAMQCNRCGLVDNLTQREKLAIGETLIEPPYRRG